MSDASFEAWWAYVVKHEIEPTMRSYCQPPVVTTPVSWPGSPLRPVKHVFHASGAPRQGITPGGVGGDS